MSNSSHQAQKCNLRQTVSDLIREMPPAQRHDEENLVNRHTVTHLTQLAKGTLLAYAALPVELNIDPVIAFALEHGWCVALPIITDIPGGMMDLHQIHSPAELIPGLMGIRQPSPHPGTIIDPAEIDVALIPAWAFDQKSGARLGKGGGFYDRLLADPSWCAKSYGIAYRCQLHNEIPVESHDKGVDGIFSPDGLLRP